MANCTYIICISLIGKEKTELLFHYGCQTFIGGDGDRGPSLGFVAIFAF